MKKSLMIIVVIILSGCSQNTNHNDSVKIQNSMTSTLENCTSWFNGCNTCFVENGVITGCTERYCLPEEYKEAKCNKYKE